MEELIHLTDLTNLPLSFNQKRLWVIYQQDKQNPAYNINITYKLKGNIKIEILRNSVEVLFNRHHTMFSVFKQTGGQPFIEIIPRPVTLKVIDFSQLSLVDREREILSYFGKDLRECFDMEKGPLYRLFLLKYDEECYYFNATIHHILFDGTSYKLFVEELSSIYNNLIGYSDEKPQPLLYQSYDFAALEAESKPGKDEKVLVNFWKEYLKDSPPEIKFPYDYPRKNSPTGLGGKVALSIPEEITNKLKEIAVSTKTSLFKTLMSVLGLLLQRYSGENDVCIGFPVSTRRANPDLQKIFGMFVNTSVVRLKSEEDINFKELVLYTKDAVGKAIENSKLPFESIVDALNPERRPNVNPIFQVAFSWVTKMFPQLDLQGNGNERINLFECVSTFDISFYMWEEENHIEGEIEFNTDILKRETILRLKDNFLSLLENLTNNPEVNINSIPLITEEETKQLLAFTDMRSEYPRDKSIVELFNDQVQLYPEKTAVVFKEESLTYKQLNDKADNLARTLQDQGVKRNMPVGILTTKSLEMIVGTLGILKAGGAYVPIAPDYPEQRMNFIISDSGCKVLVTQTKFMELKIFGVTKVNLNAEREYNQKNHIIKNINIPDDLAYIMYTSGTTGKPKGTPVPHQGVVRLVRNTNYIDFTPDDRILQAGAIVFDATTFEIWGALLNGGSLYLVEKETFLDPGLLGEELLKNEITIILLTSSLFTQIADSGSGIFKKLKYLLVGGDVVSPPHINKVRKDNPQLTVFNAYGPTENSCISTCYKIDRDYEYKIPIGKPISNSTAYIFDKYMNYQPVGVIGELYVGGDGLSKGYINREDLNKVCFVNHPYIPGERIYKTGDFARWLPDGNIEFYGRVDNQLKIRGFRVELEEIENVISKLNGVNETVITPVKVEEGDYRLVAFLNVSENFRKDTKEVITLLRSSLPPYMIPSSYRFMHGFPKTINGKTDRKALEFDLKEIVKEERVDVKTLTPNQKLILRIWSEALKTYNIALTDSFFDSGGNSLLAISVLNSIREQIGYSMTFKEFLTYPSVIQSGDYIDSQITVKDKKMELIHLTGTTDLPLTRNQKKLWVLTKAQPEIPSYIIGFSYKLIGNLNLKVFQDSLDLIFLRHKILFSVIKEKNGDPYCDIILSKVDISFIDYSQLPANEKERRVKDFIQSDSVKVFDLENGPLYRLYIIKTEPDEYYFHVSIHHIVFDGWSWSIFVNELNDTYNSLLRGKSADLGELEFQQYDYAHWEETSESSNDDRELKEFWKENLDGASPILNFPYDFHRKEQQSGKGRYEIFTISQNISDKLRAISKSEGASLFTTLLSVFGIEMHKYSGEDDINIGLPVAYRPHSKLETIFGMFVNTVLVRLRYPKDHTFREMIRLTNDAALNAIAHQDLTFDKVVEIVNPKRYPNVNPLFQVAFAWQNNLDKPIKLDGLRSEKLIIEEKTIPFDLLISFWENGPVIEGEIGYSTDLLKQETIVRLKNSFLNLVNELIENSDTTIDSPSIISDEEEMMIGTVNDTYADFSKNKTITTLFEERAILDPEKIAVISDDCELTYSELNAKADRLAQVLQAYAIGTGDFVGLLLNRSPELIICLLAIFKTGAAYVPLNITDPESRILSIIDGADIKFVITHSDNNKLNLKSPHTELKIEQLLSRSDSIRVKGGFSHQKSSDAAYIIFTSGTTGLPKGVLVNHRSVVNIIEWVNKTFKVSYNDKLLWITNLSFDLSVYDIFGILAAGASVRIINEEDRLEPKKQYDLLINEGITFWDSAPQSLMQVAHYFNNKGNRSMHNSLRIVFLSGDWIPLSLPETIKKTFPYATVVGLGGATEATIWSNYFIIDKIDPEWKSIPYGKPIQNARYYILNDKMNHCGIRQPGKLYIGGECLAVGYYNDKILTDSKFVRDPFNSNSRLYLTGDKAQWMEDGNIEFLGREDEQLKVRGYRVETGEIKNVVLKNKLIKEAIILPDKTDRHNIKVILFFTTFNGAKPEVKDLKAELRKHLPEYMIPDEIIHYEEFPVTSNGKVNTNSLLSDYLRLVESRKANSKAETGEEVTTLSRTQKFLLNIWIEVLNNKDISAQDSFFDIGGNSLLAFKLINSIKERTGIKFSFRELISYPSVTECGNYIDCQPERVTRTLELTHLTGSVNLPLTRNQKRLWLISKLHPSLPSYIIGFSYKLSGALDREMFQKSLDFLFHRHNILFSVIKEINSEPYCDIFPSTVELSFIDYSNLPENEKIKKVNEIISADSQKAFDLKTGPLYRIYLIMTAKNEYYFHLSLHHIVFDGWSWSVFADDLNEIYSSLIKGVEIKLEELEFQQYDYARWEESSVNSEIDNESIAFWKENLKGASTFHNFPYDFQRMDRPSEKGSFESIQISPDLSEKLKQISKTEGSSLFATLMSIFGIELHKYSGDNDINIGMPVAYRPHSKLEKIFGMFVNTVVVRLRYEKELSFRDIIHRTNEAALNGIAHQDLTFEKVVEIANPERSSGINPLFQVAFAWQNNIDTTLKLDGITCERFTVKERSAPFEILLSMWENGEIIEGEISYATDLLKPETIIRLRDNFLTLAANLVGNPGIDIDSVEMISDEEKHKILAFTGIKTDYPRDKTIVQLFEDQAVLFSDKTAVVFKNSSLSYKQLNEKTNQLARTLRKSGVNDNSPVGILAEKSLDMIVGILGILKAGGAYVPIDPEYPDSRINYILKDSECRILLTQDKYTGINVEGVKIVDLNSNSSFSHNKSNVEGINGSQSLAYIMYTSGTTGKPKGSMIVQRSVVRLVRNTNYIDLTPDDRILLTGAIVFDATTFEIWGSLLNGATLYIIEKDKILDIKALGAELIENKISVMWLTSALFTQIAERRTDIFAGLKYLVVGGDVLSAPHINKVRKDNPKLKIINGYGPTENTTFSTTYLIDKDFEYNIPIGEPVSNSTVYIFDKDLNYKPIGVYGELYAGGDGVSKGYINREDLNKKSFLGNPYIPGDRLYKTGDYARWLPDGNIEFHGRIDNQLKIRGFRVEIEEIESVISEIDGVIETVVKPVKVEEGDYRLVAFLNVQDSFKKKSGEIAGLIKAKLPSYMVPSAFKVMSGFPKTLNGKTDRNALDSDIKGLLTKESQDLKSLTPTELIIYNIWSEILKTKDISSTDNFFDIGGNSLMVISVNTKIESAFNIELGLRVFFDSPRIKDIGEAIDILIYRTKKGEAEVQTGGQAIMMIDGEI